MGIPSVNHLKMDTECYKSWKVISVVERNWREAAGDSTNKTSVSRPGDPKIVKAGKLRFVHNLRLIRSVSRWE